jgi:hypothetical protein
VDVEGVGSVAEDAKKEKGRQEAGAGWEDVEGVESAEDVKRVEGAPGTRRGGRTSRTLRVPPRTPRDGQRRIGRRRTTR